MSTALSEIISWKDLNFQVLDANVYAPKPASLLLAEVAAQRIPPGSNVLDACTGSGVVGIAIARYVEGARVTVSDVSSLALTEAQSNATANGVSIRSTVSDMYEAFDEASFDAVTVHPPAVPYPDGSDWGLTRGMRLATDGGDDGSRLVTRSIVEASRVLRPGGEFLLLLPHWSNVPLARKHLRNSFDDVQELARLQVDFFPAKEGVPKPALIRHLKHLASTGLIEMTFESEIPVSWVSVVVGQKRSS